MENWMQLDVKKIDGFTVHCNLYADGRCVPIIMKEDDYRLLQNDGFFIRSGQERDSAGVLNTSRTYNLQK